MVRVICEHFEVICYLYLTNKDLIPQPNTITVMAIQYQKVSFIHSMSSRTPTPAGLSVEFG